MRNAAEDASRLVSVCSSHSARTQTRLEPPECPAAQRHRGRLIVAGSVSRGEPAEVGESPVEGHGSPKSSKLSAGFHSLTPKMSPSRALFTEHVVHKYRDWQGSPIPAIQVGR